LLKSSDPVTLETPDNFQVVENYLTWQPVSNANGYNVKIVQDNTVFFVAETRALVLPMYNNQLIAVQATPQNANYLESAWSSPYFVLSGSTPSGDITVNAPTYNGPALHYGDPLPVIQTTTQGGTIALNPYQILSVDIQSYTWRYTSYTGQKVLNPTGTIILQVSPITLTITAPVWEQEFSLGSPFPEIWINVGIGNDFYDTGTITIDPGQSVLEGTNSYTWTYYSSNGSNPNIIISNPTGTIELTVPAVVHPLPNPNYNFQVFRLGDPLPDLFFPETNYEGFPIIGTVAFDEGQILMSGGNYYSWTFTPTNNTLWDQTTGQIYIGVELLRLNLVNPTYSGQLSYHDPLPLLTSTTELGLSSSDFGQITLLGYQTLEIGTRSYEWNFIPFEPNVYQQEFGYISLTVGKKLVVLENPTYQQPLYYRDFPSFQTNAEGWFNVPIFGEFNVGTYYLDWTFEPTDTEHYEYINLSGVVEVTVVPLVITVNPLVSTSTDHSQTDPSLYQYYSSEFGEYHLVPGQIVEMGFHTYNWFFTPKYPFDSSNYEFINTTGTIEIQGVAASLANPVLQNSIF
ncbi:MAG: hypothetical protein EZS28_041874, partial [Streblomastix strix]